MKKNQKNPLKIGILLFGIFFASIACQKDDFNDNQEIAQEKKIKRISLHELNSRIGKSSDYSKLSAFFDMNNKKNMYRGLEASDSPWIETDEIVMIEKENMTYYTFSIGNDSIENEFYNLVVAVDELGEISYTRLLEYTPSNDWLTDRSQPFSGMVKMQDNNIFSVDEISSIFSRGPGPLCATGVRTRWECNHGNNHSPQDAADNDRLTCTSWEFQITVVYKPCPTIIDVGDSIGGGIGIPTDGGTNGGGGASDNNNDEDDTPDITDETAVIIPKDDLDDDCNTSKEDLKKVFPNMSDADASTLAHVINEKGLDFGIDTKEKLQHFLAQAGHEVGEFTNGIGVQESLYYTTSSRLKKIFKPYFKQNAADTLGTKRDADSTYLQNSSKVANYVYCCRMGNGNEASGDGYKYRGRGIFQLTGKTNYTNFKTWYNNKYDPDKDFVTNPNQVKSNDTIAILSALWYYKTSVLDKITVDSTTTSLAVTRKVNGGTNGKKHRKELYEKAKDSIDCQ